MRRTPSAMRRGMATRSMTGSRNSDAARMRSRSPDAGLVERLLEQHRPEHDVVERAPARAASSRRWRPSCAKKRCAPPIGRLVVVEERRQLGQEHRHRARLPEEPHRAVRRAAAQEAQDLLEDARAGGLREVARASTTIASYTSGAMPRSSRAANLIARRMRIGSSRKRTIGSPMVWMVRSRDVLHPAAPVEDLAAVEVVEERVDREVAPERVLVRLAEDVVAADEEVVDDLAVGVLGRLHRGVAPEGRDLDDLAAAEEDVREAEAPADDAAVAEEGPHVLGAGARGDVEVLRLAAEEQVADAAADQVRLVARCARGAGRPWRRRGRCARPRACTSWRTRPVPAWRSRAASRSQAAGVRAAWALARPRP